MVIDEEMKMTIIDDLTPTQYSLGRGKLIIRGTNVAELDFKLFVEFYNEMDERLDSRYVSLTFTDPQKQVFLDVIADEIDTLETATGLTRYEPPDLEAPTIP